jgi:hypothetical protein
LGQTWFGLRLDEPSTANPTAKGVSVVLTSCGRPDLLVETLDSFFRFNTFPITKFILVEDGHAILDVACQYQFNCDHELICTGERVGQMAAIDYAYSRVETEYVFHLEDDWQFYATGFIEKSMQILERYPQCLQVYLRALNDTNGHPIHRWVHREKGVIWRRMKYGFKAFGGKWNGFSLNPGLRRVADYSAIGGYGVHKLKAPNIHAGTEIVLSRLYRKKKMYAVILADRGGQGYVRHIGWGRTISEKIA